MKQLIECVPNFSEGRNKNTIEKIASSIKNTKDIKLLHIDSGKATNRTVFTFVGEPENVIKAAFHSVKVAKKLIDMRKHKGKHPRIGVMDVCPLVPLSNISLKETIPYAHKLAKKIGEELDYPVYCYEEASLKSKRKDLAYIRSGEYEQLKNRIQYKGFIPDFGPNEFKPKLGACAVAARDFLIAYNINLNTSSLQIAKSIAAEIRESGRLSKNEFTKEILLDKEGKPLRKLGKHKNVKAIGWYIEEYGIAQVSINLTNTRISPVHKVFESCCEIALANGVKVTGSELIGLAPLQVFLKTGKYFWKKQNLTGKATENQLLRLASDTLRLNDLYYFDIKKRIIEYLL